MEKFTESIARLKKYIEKEQFKGYDPYDGLNSRLFKALPGAKSWDVARLVWIQVFKRLPFNLRWLAGISKEYNAKGVGLLLDGYLSLIESVERNQALETVFGSKSELEDTARFLANKIVELRTPGFSGAAWGYNFPWQCRREFLFPAGEPTVVATTFCASALLRAARRFGNDEWREVALSSARFVTEDLRRTPHKDGFIFSYSRMPGNDTIYNASLLGSKLLSLCAAETDSPTEKEMLFDLARKSVAACCADQRADGSWTYGVKPVTGWVDSFHTGYNLDGIAAYEQASGDLTFHGSLEKGLDYYTSTFFNPATGQASYYNNRVYPIDIHCPGQLPMTLSRTGAYGSHRELVRKVLNHAIDTMQAPKGYFYYQLKKGLSSRISYMRWSNAFMFDALTTALKEELR